MPITIDPEFHALIDAPTRDELDLLEQSILAEGCREPIVVWHGIILDGHNRYEICTRHGKHFETTQLDFPGRPEAMIWMIQNQLSRRNINAMQRASLALKLKPLIASLANKATGGKIAQTHVDTRQALAKRANLSGRTLDAAEKIEKSPVKELSRMTKSGDVSISAAAAVASLPEKKQRIIVVRGPSAVKAAAKNIRESKPVETDSLLPDSTLVDNTLSTLAKLKGMIVALVGHEDASTQGDACGFHMRGDRQDWIKQLDTMRHTIKVSRPYSVCPYCEGNRGKTKCTACKDVGWVGKISHHACPPEYIERIKETIRE